MRSRRGGENRKVGVFMAEVMFNALGLNLVKLQKWCNTADLKSLEQYICIKDLLESYQQLYFSSFLNPNFSERSSKTFMGDTAQHLEFLH